MLAVLEQGLVQVLAQVLAPVFVPVSAMVLASVCSRCYCCIVLEQGLVQGWKHLLVLVQELVQMLEWIGN